MAANGLNGVKGADGQLSWSIGLKNHKGKYLTAESFGFEINTSASTLRFKQVWTLEIDGEDVYLRSHLGRYLSTDKKGNVKCDSERRGPENKFRIEYHEDGRWRFRTELDQKKTHFGIVDDLPSIREQDDPSTNWTVALAIHPQVILRHNNRKRYAHLNEEQGEIQCNEAVPWGEDSLITLEFVEGKYALRAFDKRYLHKDGTLVAGSSKDTLYKLRITTGRQNAGFLALASSDNSYLTAVGTNGTLKAGKKNASSNASKDETFTIEDSHPQANFTAHNGKFVSIKQGVDVSANQGERTDSETFQLEYEKKSKKWRIRTCEDKFFSLDDHSSGIQTVSHAGTGTATLFEFEWLEDGSIAMKASNGNYVTARMNGSLYAVSSAVTEKERFVMRLVNRPILVLKGDHGFVGLKNSKSARVECNKSVYDAIYLEYNEDGTYSFKNASDTNDLVGRNGKYWAVAGDGSINADSDEPQPFILEFRGPSQFKIKAVSNGQYIKGVSSGGFTARNDLDTASFWEY